MSTYVYEVQGYYTKEVGWEMVTTESTRADAQAARRTYDQEEPEYAHRIRRVKEDD